MFNLQGSEIIFILLLALVVLGPEKLPGAIRRFTRTYAELKKMGNSFQQEVKTAFDEPMREVRETADLIKQQVDVESIEAEHDEGQREAAAAFASSATTLAPTGSGVDPDAEDGADVEVGQGQHPDTAYRALEPPVAGTARPGPLPAPDDEPLAPPSPPPPTPIPPPPAPFASSHGTVPSRPAPTTDAEEGATSP